MPKAPRTPLPNHRDLPYPATAPRHPPYPSRIPSSPDDDRHSSTTWSTESDEKLLQARQKGLNWQPIANQYFPNKTPNACRKRYERLIQQKSAADSWDSVKTASLAKAYMETRHQIWAPLAEHLGEKWTVVEQKCMEKGVKTLLTLARSETRQERRESLQADDGYLPGPALLPSFNRSRSHSRDSETFHLPHTNDPNSSPFANSRIGHDEDYRGPSSANPSSAHTDSTSRFPTPNRTFSGSTSTTGFPPFTPNLGTTSPSFNSFNTSPTTTIQPQMAIPQGPIQSQTLPSLKESGIFPSLIASSLPRHHSPVMPVTTH